MCCRERSGQKRKTFARFIAYHRFMCNIILSRRSAACACARAPRHETENERDGDGANRWQTRGARAGQTETVREKLERARAPPASERFAVVHVFSTQVGGRAYYFYPSPRTLIMCRVSAARDTFSSTIHVGIRDYRYREYRGPV
ncbi:unnamed protein product [Aphis gossypii]|uniref:Uncharacterized protein n=1 Tax=Aphis gossypii TaxID=80765 RepID=A0A9P0IP67_APHGO|nr:unnamed protein product [Aphis gossypii]